MVVRFPKIQIPRGWATRWDIGMEIPWWWTALALTILLGFNAELTPDTEMLEAVCNENEQDLKLFVVTEADRKRHETVAKLAPEILAKYAGTYEPELAGPGASRKPFEITVEGDQVFLQLVNGASKFRWKPSPKPRSPRLAAQLFSSQMTGEPSPTLLYRS